MFKHSLIIGFILMLFSSIVTMSADATIGKEAPGFSLKSVDGNVHNLNDYRGKYVVLEWINFDCPFVVKHYSGKNMQNLQKEYREKGIVWLLVCSSAPGKQGNYDNAGIKQRLKDNDVNVDAYLIDDAGTVGKLYDARTTPHMYIIDTDGILIYQGGIDDKKSTSKDDIPTSKNFVKAALDEVLSGKSISTPTSQPYGCSVKYKD